MSHVHTLGALVLVVASIGLQPTWQWRVDWSATSPSFDTRDQPPLKGIVPAETPFGPAQVLNRYADPPRIFHDHRYAGFLLFHTTGARPSQRVFVDKRIDLPPDDVWSEYHRTVGDPDAWPTIFEKYGIRAAVLSKERKSGLIERLQNAENWSTVYGDTDVALLMKPAE